ncbi:Protein distal antenna-related [Nesidiocoris tenuis]|uniref:Protein distal antenna-related n=1 Tax=Nesidiocoris tenuis TaxID=355587 RepID=A0ABN7B091_9HEMI|nr:Protein distal antenna-related [Nesidiocoris tenuis]
MVLENFGFPAHDSKRQLTVEQKLEAIRRVTDFGETKASVSRMFGVPESTLRGWCKNKEKLRLLSISKKRSSTGSRKSERDDGRYGEPLTSSGPPATPESTSASNESAEYYGGYHSEMPPASPPMAHANSSPYSAPVSGPAPALDLTRLIAMYCSQATANHQNQVSPEFYNQYEPQPDYNEEPLSLVKKPQDCQPDSSLVEDSSDSLDIDDNDADNVGVEESTVKAIRHGEQFLRWLETVSDPSITRLQLLQFRSLLDKVKAASFNRKIKSMDGPIETA